MRSPTILLIGMVGVENYGCEAIVRGTEKIIRSEYVDADIVYATSRCCLAYDMEKLHDSQVRAVERKRVSRYSPKNVVRKLLSTIGVEWQPRYDSLRMLEGVNGVLSIGGDLYTLNPKGGYDSSLQKFGDAVLKKGIPYVLWGASIGSFSDNPKAERMVTAHLKRVSLITARETTTSEYLKKIGVCDNVILCADPAYVVASEIKQDTCFNNNKLTIGINLSPMSVKYSGMSIEEAISVQGEVLQELVKKLNASIMLIPHTCCYFNEGDDDTRYLRRLRQVIRAEFQKAIVLLDNDIGFAGTKKELIKCDLVIAARMHCAINSLAAHVPTILISYSHKAVGMCQYIYGNGDWVIPLSEFGSVHVLEKVRLMKEQQQKIRAYLAKRIPEIQQDAYRPMQALKEKLDS
jgi:colanic acid/amylovoran biosynthesis protein